MLSLRAAVSGALPYSNGAKFEGEHPERKTDRGAKQLEEDIVEVAVAVRRQNLQSFKGNREERQRKCDRHQAVRIGPDKKRGQYQIAGKAINVGFALDRLGSEFDRANSEEDDACQAQPRANRQNTVDHELRLHCPSILCGSIIRAGNVSTLAVS